MFIVLVLGTIERRRRRRRAMYPPLSHVFSNEDQTNLDSLSNDLPIETSLKHAGVNIKVVDIDFEDSGKKEPSPTEHAPKAEPAVLTLKQETKSPSESIKPPLVKRSSAGTLVSSRAARIKGLMDNDLRSNSKDYQLPVEDKQTMENGSGMVGILYEAK